MPPPALEAPAGRYRCDGSGWAISDGSHVWRRTCGDDLNGGDPGQYLCPHSGASAHKGGLHGRRKQHWHRSSLLCLHPRSRAVSVRWERSRDISLRQPHGDACLCEGCMGACRGGSGAGEPACKRRCLATLPGRSRSSERWVRGWARPLPSWAWLRFVPSLDLKRIQTGARELAAGFWVVGGGRPAVTLRRSPLCLEVWHFALRFALPAVGLAAPVDVERCVAKSTSHFDLAGSMWLWYAAMWHGGTEACSRRVFCRWH